MEFRLGYTPITQFGPEVPLDPMVVSDHAEIILDTPYGKIGAWNISNPVYHSYFGSRSTCSFAKTHMNSKPDQQFLQNKIADQIESIAQRLENGQVDVQIIVEGYNTFFEQLQSRLNHGNYAIVYSQEFPPSSEGIPADQKNTTGIIVNLNKFSLERSLIFTQVYEESQDRQPKRTRYLGIPVVFLGTFDDNTLAVGGVHIPGSNRRQPLDGLAHLQDVLNDLLAENINHIVLMGDYNSIPKLVGDQVKGAQIKLSAYPTHVNPNNQVSYYDMALVYGLPTAQMLSLESTSEYTQALLQSIYNCREYYLGTQ